MWFCPTQDRMCRSLESTPWPWVAEYVKHLERHGKCTMIVVTTIVRFSTEESLESCESMIFTKPVYSFQCPICKDKTVFSGAFKTPAGFEHQTGPKKYLLKRKLELDWVKSLHILIFSITFFVSVFLIPRSIFLKSEVLLMVRSQPQNNFIGDNSVPTVVQSWNHWNRNDLNSISNARMHMQNTYIDGFCHLYKAPDAPNVYFPRQQGNRPA